MAKKSTSKATSSRLLRTLPKFKRLQALVAVVVVAGAGAYYIISSFAGSSTAVSTSANTIVLEYISPHAHGSSTDVLPEFSPEPAIVYGNGLLLCGVGHNHAADATPLRSAKLTSSQLSSLLSSVANTGVFGLPEVTSADGLAVSATEDSVAINYLSGAKKTAYFTGAKPAALSRAEAIITAKCATVHQAYDPEGVVITSKRISATDSSQSTVDGTGIELASTNEPHTIELHGIAASYAKTKFGGHTKANVTRQDALYAATVQPILPTANPITYRQPAGTAVAASVVPMRMYWFRPSEIALYSGYAEYATISSSIRSFYAAQVAGKSSTLVNAGVVVGQQTSAYYHACHVGTCSTDGDLNAYNNIYAEMKARGYIPANQSVNVLSQVPSARGSAWCYGYGGPVGTVRNVTSGFGITFGFGRAGQSCEAGTSRYWVPAHEYGHSLGLAHTCGEVGSLMETCNGPAYNSAWTSYFHINAGQRNSLNIDSLGLNQRIQGRVYNGSTNVGIAGASVYTCTYGTIKTDASGYFDLRIGTQAGFCLRVSVGAPSGYKLTTYNNAEHAGAASYEFQVAGYNCYHNTACTSLSQQTWDRPADSGYNFNYTP